MSWQFPITKLLFHFFLQDSFCHFEEAEIGAQLSGYVNVTSGSIDALKEAIATKGPCAVGIDASHLSFVFYANGVYYEPSCGEYTKYYADYLTMIV